MRPAVFLIAVVAAAVAATMCEGAPLATDPAAMEGWRGTQRFSVTGVPGTLEVDVEYAVYEKTKYPGDDPSSGSDYVYAYEIFNDVNPASVAASMLTVGILADSLARNIGWDTSVNAPGQTGGVTPDLASISVATLSAKWAIFTDPVTYGKDSVTLLFTSPYGPRWMPSSVADAGLSAIEPLPSPMPEPATAGLVGIGLLWCLARRRRCRAGIGPS